MSGDGVVAHNRRTYFAENVDQTRTHLNIEYIATLRLRKHITNCSMRLRKNTMPSRNAKTAALKTTTKKSVTAIRKSLFMK